MESGYRFECMRCSATFPRDLPIDSRGCPNCSGDCPANLAAVPGDLRPRRDLGVGQAYEPRSMWDLPSPLPCRPEDAITLGEGLTPLIPACRLARILDIGSILFKNEAANPTGSHKDRFSTVAASIARQQGARVLATASSGNAGASLAAYAARANIDCVVATMANASGAMLGQIRKYGAIVVPMANKFDRWRLLEEGMSRYGWLVTSPFRAPVVGSHPLGIEGYKTVAYEIAEQTDGDVPEWCALPVCYGDALVGIWRGFEELRRDGAIARSPRMIAAEVFGSLTRAIADGADTPPDLAAAFEPFATSIGATQSTFQALWALRASDGRAVVVGNTGLLELQEKLATTEGLFVELSSATPIAAISRLRREGEIGPRDRVICIVTASGLKDVERTGAGKTSARPFGSTKEAWTDLSKRLELVRRRRPSVQAE